MACKSVGISGASPANAASSASSGMRRSASSNEIRCDIAGIRRSRSEPQLPYSLSVSARSAPAPAPKLKSSRSIGIFPFGFSGSTLPSSLRSFLFDSEEHGNGVQMVDPEEEEDDPGGGAENRANWVERLMELRRRWRDRQQQEEEEGSDYNCGVSYGSEDEDEERSEWDRDSFSRLLNRTSWYETKLFSRLAFLSNMAYVIPEIKEEDLRKYYGLRLVTSSLEKKAEAAAIKAKLEIDSTRPPPSPTGPGNGPSSQRPLLRASIAYEIAASAASYVHTRAKGLLSFGAHQPEYCERDELPEPRGLEGGPNARMYNSEVAAYVAATTMTAVVAAEEEARHEAAMGLRSLHSSPCEWFVCDDPGTCTRYFVIQVTKRNALLVAYYYCTAIAPLLVTAIVGLL